MLGKTLTAVQVADLLSVSPHTIRRWADGGVLPAIRVGRCVRFREVDIERLVGRTAALSSTSAAAPAP